MEHKPGTAWKKQTLKWDIPIGSYSTDSLTEVIGDNAIVVLIRQIDKHWLCVLFENQLVVMSEHLFSLHFAAMDLSD